MTDRIWVEVGGKDRRVPVEGRRGVYFEQGKAHNVRLTPFIQRRLDDKDLVKTDPPAVPVADAQPSAETPAVAIKADPQIPPAVESGIRSAILSGGNPPPAGDDAHKEG